MLYYFKKAKNTTEMQKKICSVWKGTVIIEDVKSSLQSFVLDIFC